MADARGEEERGGDRPSARRVPQDLQLLPDVPPVHVRRVLERHRGPVPDLRADRGPRGARDARPRGDGAGARRHQRARRACRRRSRAGPVAGGRPVAGSPRARARHRCPGRRRDRGRGPDAARGRCRRGRVRHPGDRVHRGHDGRRGLDWRPRRQRPTRARLATCACPHPSPTRLSADAVDATAEAGAAEDVVAADLVDEDAPIAAAAMAAGFADDDAGPSMSALEAEEEADFEAQASAAEQDATAEAVMDPALDFDLDDAGAGVRGRRARPEPRRGHRRL